MAVAIVATIVFLLLRPSEGAGFNAVGWVIIAAGIALGGGLLLGGFGVSALVVRGQCIDTATTPALVCDFAYSTSAIGGGLLGAGLALSTVGTLMLAWP